MGFLIRWLRRTLQAIQFAYAGADRVAALEDEIHGRMDAQREMLAAHEEFNVNALKAITHLAERVDAMGSEVVKSLALAEDVKASHGKQLADLRCIVNNLREEAKRGPISARDMGNLRRFVATTGEGE